MLPGGWKVHKTFAWRNGRSYCVVSKADFQSSAGEVHNPERTILPIATILQQTGETIAKGSIAATSGATREPQDKISETAGAIFDPAPLRTHPINSAVSLAAVIGLLKRAHGLFRELSSLLSSARGSQNAVVFPEQNCDRRVEGRIASNHFWKGHIVLFTEADALTQGPVGITGRYCCRYYQWFSCGRL
jgi:hypothetical protein